MVERVADRSTPDLRRVILVTAIDQLHDDAELDPANADDYYQTADELADRNADILQCG